MGGESTTLKLRRWRPADEQELVRIANDRAVWRNLTDRFAHPYTVADARDWISIAHAAPSDARNWAIEVEGRVAGAVGFERLPGLHGKTAEIGYWLGRAYWGRGLATEALRRATAVALGPEFDFVRVQAGILGWNRASCRVAEKCGYTLEATLQRGAYKDGEVCDYLIYVRFPEAPSP
jgi:RimJ/RimL family protein N-acetyltransferase